ncbi:MAG: M48 family metalloprotease, partial [Gammaproteobacteria bacterium]
MKKLRFFARALPLLVLLVATDGHGYNLLDEIKDEIKKVIPTFPAIPAQRYVNRQEPDNETLEPSSDRLCDSLSRSYTFTENLTELVANQLKCKVMKCRLDEAIPTDDRHFDTWLRNYSKKRVWLPAPLEQSIGAAFLSDQQAKGGILERGLPNTEKLYAKVDQALAAAKQSYPGVPYDLKTYVVDITDRVNAQASPGGYIFVTKAAAKDLEQDALQLVIGHEVAHLAKRHMSKQLQQRLMGTEQGVG